MPAGVPLPPDAADALASEPWPETAPPTAPSAAPLRALAAIVPAVSQGNSLVVAHAQRERRRECSLGDKLRRQSMMACGVQDPPENKAALAAAFG